MTFETTLVYNEPMLRKAVLRFWWRVIGIRFLLVLAALGLLLAFLIIQGIAPGRSECWARWW